MGWQLGATLYEINSLPWTYDPSVPDTNSNEAEFEQVLSGLPTDSRTLTSWDVLLVALLTSFLSIGVTLHVIKRSKNQQLGLPQRQEGGRLQVEMPPLFEGTPLSVDSHFPYEVIGN